MADKLEALRKEYRRLQQIADKMQNEYRYLNCKRRKLNNAEPIATTSMFRPEHLLKKMFESGTGDWEMIGYDGKAHKFHQAVLTEQVPHFRRLFAHSETLECTEKRIVVPEEIEMSDVAVEAFLRYVYYHDETLLAKTFSVTCALIRAGHYYDIPKLVETANEIIRQNGTGILDWFTVDDLWKLYQHVWLWEDAHPCKGNLMETIVEIMKRFCDSKSDSEKLLLITDGNKVLRDFIVQISQNQKSQRPPLPPKSPRNATSCTSWANLVANATL